MSTNINITVGDNALLDRAKQQQTANRQAQLQKEATLRLEAQAKAARTTALAAQGRDANGNLITGAPFTQPQIDRRPAANRQGDALPYFYWKTAFNSSTERTEYTFISGNGLISSTYTPATKRLESAILDQLTPLVQSLPIDGSWSVSNPTSYTFTTATRATIVLIETGPEAGFYTTTERYEANRDIPVLNAEREFLFSMGDDTALFVAYRQEACKSSRRLYYTRLYRKNAIGPGGSVGIVITDELQAATYTNTEEIPTTTVTDIGCFRIGHKVCNRVVAPAALSVAIDNLIPEPEEFADTYTAQLPSCSAPPAGCSGFPPSGEITVDIVTLGWADQDDYGVQNGMPANLGYGVTYQGSIPDYQCSPAAWFALGDKTNDKIFSFGQHINAETPLAPVSGTAFAALFTPSQYIGIPVELKGDFGIQFALNLSVASSLRPFKYYSSEYMSGSVFAEAYPYTLPAWRISSAKIPSSTAVNPTPDQFWRRSFIYDWGKSGFCGQQKAQYGITYTPFTP